MARGDPILCQDPGDVLQVGKHFPTRACESGTLCTVTDVATALAVRQPDAQRGPGSFQCSVPGQGEGPSGVRPGELGSHYSGYRLRYLTIQWRSNK